MKKLWFKQKVYGFGWSPSSYEGWLVIFFYFIVLFYFASKVDSTSHSGSDTLFGVVIPFALLTALLVSICYITGEKPTWRWGCQRKETSAKK